MNHVDLGWVLFTHNPKLHGQALLVLRISLVFSLCSLDSHQFIKTHHTLREKVTVIAPALRDRGTEAWKEEELFL